MGVEGYKKLIANYEKEIKEAKERAEFLQKMIEQIKNKIDLLLNK